MKLIPGIKCKFFKAPVLAYATGIRAKALKF